MKRWSKCNHGALVDKDGVLQTTNKMDWYFSSGGVSCCKWNTFTTTNCFLYHAKVFKRHSESSMQSTAGSVDHSDYLKGHCALRNLQYLIWEVDSRESCEYLPWKRLKGNRWGHNWLSEDSNIAFTTTHPRTEKDCAGKTMRISDQGIPYTILGTPRSDHESYRKKRPSPNSTRKGIVSSAQLAASLQVLELKTRRNIQFAFHHALSATCHSMAEQVRIARASLLQNPTLAMREIFGQDPIIARASASAIEVWALPNAELL